MFCSGQDARRGGWETDRRVSRGRRSPPISVPQLEFVKFWTERRANAPASVPRLSAQHYARPFEEVRVVFPRYEDRLDLGQRRQRADTSKLAMVLPPSLDKSPKGIRMVRSWADGRLCSMLTSWGSYTVCRLGLGTCAFQDRNGECFPGSSMGWYLASHLRMGS